MSGTHDYETKSVKPSDLDSTCVLVGECGGLSAIVGDCKPIYQLIMTGTYRVETEHGILYLDSDLEVDILDLP